MKPLYTKTEYKLAKSRDKLPLECHKCKKIFYKEKHFINPKQYKYCSKHCQYISKITQIKSKCDQCGVLISKNKYQYNRSKFHFCSWKCAGIYGAAHKTKGTRRSKLETYIEKQLSLLYPNIDIHYNKTAAINSELDIYIPSLNLAIELNGIFHYEPIFGKEKLTSIKNNDERKFQACLEKNIEFCIIDTSKQKYFKESTAKPYLDIITNIINKKLVLHDSTGLSSRY